jgi:hypothetical protein
MHFYKYTQSFLMTRLYFRLIYAAPKCHSLHEFNCMGLNVCRHTGSGHRTLISGVSLCLVFLCIHGIIIVFWGCIHPAPVAQMGESSRVLIILDFWRTVQDTDTERYPNSRSFSWFFIVPNAKSTGPQFKVLSKRLISNFSCPAQESNQ